MAKVATNPQGTEKLLDSKTNAAFPNDSTSKAGPTFKSGMQHADRNMDPKNEGGYREMKK